MAREATLRANSERTAVELPVEEPEEGEAKPSTRPTRRADIRIEAEGGSPVTFIDGAAHCSMAQCRTNPHPLKKETIARDGENEQA